VKEFKCGVLVPGCWATFHGESDDEIIGVSARLGGEVGRVIAA
jgi:predicted small metal-binding protein